MKDQINVIFDVWNSVNLSASGSCGCALVTDTTIYVRDNVDTGKEKIQEDSSIA